MYHVLEIGDVQQVVALATLYDGSLLSLFVICTIVWAVAIMDILDIKYATCACNAANASHSHELNWIRMGGALFMCPIHPYPILALLGAFEMYTKYPLRQRYYYSRKYDIV